MVVLRVGPFADVSNIVIDTDNDELQIFGSTKSWDQFISIAGQSESA